MDRDTMYERFAAEIYCKLVLCGMSHNSSPKEFGELPFKKAMSFIGRNISYSELDEMLTNLEKLND